MMNKRHLPWLAAVLLLSGCAAEVVRHPAELVAVDRQAAKAYVLLQPAPIILDSGYQRTLRAGTEFIDAGTLTQGKVIKPTNAVFTIEGAHSHEAYPVLRQDRIVGFFMPVEKTFSPLSHTVVISLEERKQ